jgi:hypothetical protein
MKTITTLLVAGAVFLAAGCKKKDDDPRNRPDFVDTSDPSKLKMPGPPKAKGGGAGAAGAGAGAGAAPKGP